MPNWTRERRNKIRNNLLMRARNKGHDPATTLSTRLLRKLAEGPNMRGVTLRKVAKIVHGIAVKDRRDDDQAGAIPEGEAPFKGVYKNRIRDYAPGVDAVLARALRDAPRSSQPQRDMKTFVAALDAGMPRDQALAASVVPVADGGGLRKDDGKNKLELLPPEWVWGLGMVLTQGAEKYLVRNWERGMSWGKMIGCGLRHVLKFICGERYDRESGCHHLLHASWNFLSLMSYDLRGIGENDLPSFNAAGLRVMLLVCDPNHPRTKKLLKEEEQRVRDSHARYEEKVT